MDHGSEDMEHQLPHSLDIISWHLPYIKHPGGLQDTPAAGLILEELTVITGFVAGPELTVHKQLQGKIVITSIDHQETW